MNATTHKVVDVQAELISSLLEGEDLTCWVVIPVDALVTQIQIALRETRDRNKAHRPGLAVARLVQTLSTLGWTKNTKHTDVAPAPHGQGCTVNPHPHGVACSRTCPTCEGVQR